jgi:hypothetical protein
LCKDSWKSAIKVSRTIPAADRMSNHELLIAVTRVKLKKSKEHRPMQRKVDLEHIAEHDKHAVGKKFKTLDLRNPDSDNLWKR